MTARSKVKSFDMNRCNSAVLAALFQSQQSNPKSSPAVASAKQKAVATAKVYRPSGTSATMRIPHELRAKVSALLVEYRKQHREDPDRW